MLRAHAGEDPERVIVLRTLGAPQRRLLRGRRGRKVAPTPAPTPVATGRATVIDTDALADEAAAKRWMSASSPDDVAAAALHTLNRVMHAHRVADADPSARDLSREQALVVRAGYGAGEEVAEGRFTKAVDLPPVKENERRTAALRPQERLAALLSGRDVALACEELVLRARADVDAGRGREAALSLRVALEAAIAELEPWAQRGDLATRLAGLRDRRHGVGAAANRALQGGLDAEETKTVTSGVVAIEAALRARTAGGLQ